MEQEWAIQLSQQQFQQQVLKDGQVALVDFWAPWCGPCRMLSPVLEQIASDFRTRALVGKVNVDEFPDLAREYRVATIPTAIVFKDGVERERIVGIKEKTAYADMLNLAL